MAEHATAAGRCYFMVRAASESASLKDDAMACSTSMQFCDIPLRLTTDVGSAIYSACADANPMAASTAALVSLPTSTSMPLSTSSNRDAITQSQPPPPPPPPTPPPLPRPDSAFVRVADGARAFERSGRPYRFVGTTLWYGASLGLSGEGGDRARLLRELDALKELGVHHVRVLAASEGTSETPYHVVPAMQPTPGAYSRDALEGLDYLLRELARRDMLAVLVLNNGLPWSGGMVCSAATRIIPVSYIALLTDQHSSLS